MPPMFQMDVSLWRIINSFEFIINRHSTSHSLTAPSLYTLLNIAIIFSSFYISMNSIFNLKAITALFVVSNIYTTVQISTNDTVQHGLRISRIITDKQVQQCIPHMDIIV